MQAHTAGEMAAGGLAVGWVQAAVSVCKQGGACSPEGMCKARVGEMARLASAGTGSRLAELEVAA